MTWTQGTGVIAKPGGIDFNKIARELKVLGYSVIRTTRDEDALISAASAFGSLIGARSLGVTHLRATGSDVWLGRHTETLTDARVPIRYFALGCLVPAVRRGETLLFDGRKAARLLATSLHGAREVRIRYRSQYRPEVADHCLIATRGALENCFLSIITQCCIRAHRSQACGTCCASVTTIRFTQPS
jgi:hypothetical protein